MILRQRTAPALCLGLALLFCAACGGTDGDSPLETKPTPANAGPVKGGILTLGTAQDMLGINEYILPAVQFNEDLLSNIFQQLVEEQADFFERPPTLKPQLAKAWEFSDDRLEVTFRLHEDAVWSDGEPITAEDVRWTYEVQTSPEIAWEGAYLKENIEAVEVLDPQTVRFRMSRATPSALLDINEGRILPKHAWSVLPLAEWRENADWFFENQVVSGPFRVASWQRQQQITLEANERYRVEGRPYLKQAIFRVVPDRSNQIAQALAGKLDVIWGLSTKDLERIERSDIVEPLGYWSRGYAFVAWNNDHPLFEEPEVRRALCLAMDREGLVESIWGDYGRVGVSPILTNIWAFNDELSPWPYDPKEATRLLNEKGWTDSDGDGILDRDGKPFSFEILVHQSNQQRIDAVVQIQESLSRIGVEARPRIIAFANLVQLMQAREYEALVMKFSVPTDLNLRYAFHSSETVRQGQNVFNYRNQEVDRLIDAAAQVAKPEELRTYLDPLQEILHREQPLTVLWESQNLAVVNQRVRDAQPNFLRVLWHLQDWWIDSTPH